jgi:hypothetical protein
MTRRELVFALSRVTYALLASAGLKNKEKECSILLLFLLFPSLLAVLVNL